MGTRIHKAIGYGVKLTRAKVTSIDPKVHECEPGTLAKIMRAAYDRGTPEVRRALGFDMPHPDFKQYPDISDVVRNAFYPDVGKGPVIFIPPMEARSWHRYDDMIDYTENLIADGGMKDLYRELEHPFYPYIFYHDPKTGERLKDYHNILDRKEFIATHGYPPMPGVPESVIVLAKYLKIDWLKLRPCMVTWWS